MLAFANSWDTTDPIGTESNILAFATNFEVVPDRRLWKNPTWGRAWRKKWPTSRMSVLGKGGSRWSHTHLHLFLHLSRRWLQYSTTPHHTSTNATPHANASLLLASPALTIDLSQQIKSCRGRKKGNRGCQQVLSRRRQPWAFVAKLRSLLWMEKERECFVLPAVTWWHKIFFFWYSVAPIIYGIVIPVVIRFDFSFSFHKQVGWMNMILYPVHIISRFSFYKYIAFTMYLDTTYRSRFILKVMYIEKLKLTYNLD